MTAVLSGAVAGRWRPVVIVAYFGVVGSLVLLVFALLQPTTYEATAKVLLPAQQEALIPGAALQDANGLSTQIATQAEIVISPPVREIALSSGLVDRDIAPDTDVSAHGVGQTRILAVVARAELPSVARATAQAYADAYVTYKLDSRSAALDALTDAVDLETGSLRDQQMVLSQQLAAMAPQDQLRSGLATRIASLGQEIDQLAARFDAVALQAASTDTDVVMLASPETAVKVSLTPTRAAIFGGVAGLLLGMAVVLLLLRIPTQERVIAPIGAR